MTDLKKRNANKIFMCSSVHVWSDTRIYFKEAKTLATEGFQVDFYAQDHPGEKEELDNLTMHYLPVLGRKKRAKHRKTLYNEFMASDAFHLHVHDPELLFLARKVKRQLGDDVHVVYDMHEHLPAAILTKQWIPKICRRVLSTLVAKVERTLMKHIDTVIFAEKSYRDNYDMLDMEKVDILNYPVVPPKLTIPKDGLFTMVYCGLLTEQRGLFEMLELASTLKKQDITDFRLKLIGPVFTDEEKITRFVDENNLAEHIICHDRMQYKDIWQHYYTAHVGLCLLHPTPNNLNSHSTKLFEYMAAGLPILASDFPSFTKILTTEHCGLTADPFNPEKLAKIVLHYKQNPDEATQIGERGKQAFAKHYNWENEANKLIKLYAK